MGDLDHRNIGASPEVVDVYIQGLNARLDTLNQAAKSNPAAGTDPYAQLAESLQAERDAWKELADAYEEKNAAKIDAAQQKLLRMNKEDITTSNADYNPSTIDDSCFECILQAFHSYVKMGSVEFRIYGTKVIIGVGPNDHFSCKVLTNGTTEFSFTNETTNRSVVIYKQPDGYSVAYNENFHPDSPNEGWKSTDFVVSEAPSSVTVGRGGRMLIEGFSCMSETGYPNIAFTGPDGGHYISPIIDRSGAWIFVPDTGQVPVTEADGGQ